MSINGPSINPAPAVDAPGNAVVRRRLVVRAACAALLVGVGLGVCYHLWGLPLFGRPFGSVYRIDLDVYRIGGSVYTHGGDIYSQLPPTRFLSRLPFTYPPFAAVLFGPMSYLPLAAVSAATTIASLVALFASIVVVLRSLGFAASTGRSALVATAVFAAALLLEPVSKTLDYGQVNILLMALVLADCLPAKTPWPRGLLIGIVAAFKLTPAVFVLFFLVRKDFRSAGRAAIGFVAATGVGFALAPHASVRYWTETLFDSERIGRPAYPPNQSIVGMLARLGADGVRTPIWVVLGLAVLTLTVLAMRRAVADGQPALALAANALAGLLVSPVSWSHHWVWAIPLLLALGASAYRHNDRRLASVAVIGTVLFRLAPHWSLSDGRSSGLGWPLIDQVAASSYLWWGLATLILLAVTPTRTQDRRSGGVSWPRSPGRGPTRTAPPRPSAAATEKPAARARTTGRH